MTPEDKILNTLAERMTNPNSVYRGKYLGTTVTAAQYSAIADGSFKGLCIGDYWTIGGINYRIAAFDYWLNTGDTALTQHHAVIVPDTVLYKGVMNATHITTGGYAGSVMRNTGLVSANTTIKAAFPNHVIKRRAIFTNAVTNGVSSGVAWYDSEIDLMNEVMVYGTKVWCAGKWDVGVSKSQLPLFFYRPDLMTVRGFIWFLRDVVSATSFASVSNEGHAGDVGAAYANGYVRPAFAIG